MSDWWNNLSQRERIMILVAGGLTSAFILVQLIVAPALSTAQSARLNVDRASRNLDIVSSLDAAPAGQTQHSQSRFDNPDTFRKIILESANNTGLRVSRVQMSDENTVIVQLDDATEQLVFQWLLELKQSSGAETTRATMTQTNDNRVRSSFEFAMEP